MDMHQCCQLSTFPRHRRRRTARHLRSAVRAAPAGGHPRNRGARLPGAAVVGRERSAHSVPTTTPCAALYRGSRAGQPGWEAGRLRLAAPHACPCRPWPCRFASRTPGTWPARAPSCRRQGPCWTRLTWVSLLQGGRRHSSRTDSAPRRVGRWGCRDPAAGVCMPMLPVLPRPPGFPPMPRRRRG
jgi:hypothetical protein